MKTPFIVAALLLAIQSVAQAGSLANGQWQARGCGNKPPAPAINTQSVDDFNQSIKDINVWQAKVQDYYNCIVKEANADNEVIAKSANAAQEEFRQEVGRIQKEADAGKAKVEKK